jgi:UDPglucose 6-dehydrogenase
MKIGIFGTGYVGLVTGTCFAEMGNDVICADIDSAKIRMLEAGGCPIYEPGLSELIQSNREAGRLAFTTDLVATIAAAETLFIAVGTPPGEDGSADLSHVLAVAESIARHMDGYRAIVTKSTVPVGTAGKVRARVTEVLKARGASHAFDVISNPEFLKEGTAVEDCLKPSRVVVGCESGRAEALMKDLYLPFLKNGNPLYVMDILSSEMTKYAANAMLATKISFINELSRLCERVGADVENVRQGIGSDPRIGPQFIYPGLGYGGSCFPKDVKALIRTGEEHGEDLQILKTVERANQLQRDRFFDRVRGHFDGDLKGRTIAFWGLAFKPGTDDVREAPAIDLIRRFVAAGATVRAHDPVATETAQRELGVLRDVSFFARPYDAIEGADALCVVTEWKPFREPDFARMKALMKMPLVFDGRNLYEPARMKELGFLYCAVGRP